MNSKITYLLISLLCLTSSCDSDTPADNIAEGVELSFNVSSQSRASETVPFTQFAVYGDIKATSGSASPVGLFDKTLVEYKNGNWSYAEPQYWAPNYEHSFVAVAPVSVLAAANSPRYENSHLSFSYKIPMTIGNAINITNIADIMVATHRRLYDNNGFVITPESKITLKFSHIMSQINVAPAFFDNIRSSEEYISFHKVEISGVYTKSQFDILPASRQSNSQTDDMVLNVTGQEKGSLAFSFNPAIKIENNATNVNLFTNNNRLILLPQEFAANSDAVMTLTYSLSFDPTVKQISIPLNNQKWESGKSYVYKFLVEQTGVVLDNCEINPWNNIPAGEITVD